MGKQTAPTAPSPQATAAAQTASNRETAITQAGLNAVNQVSPDGTSTWTQTGTWPDGTPKFQQTTALSGTNQQIYDAGQAAKLNLANVAQEQSGRLGGLLSQPFSLDNDAVESRITELANKRLQPELDRKRATLATTLANKGIKENSEAWKNAWTLADQGENDARNQLLLNARQQAVSEALTARSTPINELLALSGQAQIATPTFAGTPQTGVAGTDIAGITQQGYANQMNAYNQQQAGNQQLLGGLFGLGSSLLISDERVKKDIEPEGVRADGIPKVSFRYTWDDDDAPKYHGVLAQDVAEVKPEAVAKIGGLLAIRPEMLGA